MIGYDEILNQGQVDQFLSRCVGFHDSIIREVRIVNRTHVASNYHMFPIDRYDASLLIQMQLGPGAVELFFHNVKEIQLGVADENDSAVGRVVRNDKSIDQGIELEFDSGFRIVAERLFWRERPEFLGRAYRLAVEPPSIEAVSAITLEGDWRQCSSCSDAWQESRHIQFSRCPLCGQVTELT